MRTVREGYEGIMSKHRCWHLYAPPTITPATSAATSSGSISALLTLHLPEALTPVVQNL